MNELIKINYDETTDKATVSGRELHEALGIETPYHKWFPRMCEYGFAENEDFWTFKLSSTGGRPGFDHKLTISMANCLCKLQRRDNPNMIKYLLKYENLFIKSIK